jgi:hypothetical protein
VTYGANDELEAACTGACGGPTCGWDCDRNPLTDECITYPVSLGAYRCGQAAAPDPTGSNAWTCTAFCSPKCSGKNCGPDGCGPAGMQGVCGQCINDPQSQCPMACSAAGKCDKVCADCFALGWECGSNCCGGICGSCMPPSTCDAGTHHCSCVPSCAGKACGDDGCGGSCGACGAGLSCDAGQCRPAAAEPEPEVVEIASDPGVTDPGGPDPSTPGADGAPPIDVVADKAPSGDTPASLDLARPYDAAGTGDAGCPPGSSLVSGMCLKDLPQGSDRAGGDGGGGCAAGGDRRAGPAWLLLAALLGLALARRAGERG